ncbi:zinc ABC transporter ATPase [Mangrovibacter sp. MFB070]|uniref:zinc/cadmium/mercury/lead-transporting ATPase n=1 Tax=Mangrovibacter sp. MFB070 TaxID=1224318 RepID=UPI0004D87EF2|nr:zinc/cadmium/mercury/lead-transporting ATPase [Mangrovibacter sp. MFB070]KEA50749.1 zinc ABC transporter ATPase [Mangrovibacter sp. MFB070]
MRIAPQPNSPQRQVPSLSTARLKPIAPSAVQPTKMSCCQGETACCTATPHAEATTSKMQAASQRFQWRVEGMDCAACARKVETAVRQLTEAKQVQVVFASEKLVVDADSDIRSQVERAVNNAGYRLHSNTQPVVPTHTWRDYLPLLALTAMMLCSWAVRAFSPTAGQVAFILTTLVGLWPVARQALKSIKTGSPFSIETLMTVAALGALFIGATAEAAMVLLLFMLGEHLEGYAAQRARSGVSALMALKPDTATRLRDGQRETVPAESLRPGDIIEIAAGGRLPADGTLNDDIASFDESALTGESVPVVHRQYDVVPAGSTSVENRVTLTVVSRPGENAIDRILNLIEQAESRKAPVERFIDRFSRVYTPLVILLALLTTLLPPLLFAAPWQEWIYKGLTLLLIGCPCALVISTPAAITSALAAGARFGALIKGGAALEQLGTVRHIAFDKTGTLTLGKPSIVHTETCAEISENELLRLAATVEQGATHPLAQAIVTAAQQKQLALPEALNQRVVPGKGIQAQINSEDYFLCAPDAAPDGVLTPQQRAAITDQETAGRTLILVVALTSRQLLGYFALQDTLRPDARDAIARLQAMGIRGTMLTGDNPRAAAAIARDTGLEFQAGLLPADKVAAVARLREQGAIAMVGDGINDAPAMKAATTGIAMGNGTDVALEAADAAITHSNLGALPDMIRLARSAHNNIRQNITLALGLKGIFLVTSLLGITGLWLAVLADSGATALVTLNALRLLRQRAR